MGTELLLGQIVDSNSARIGELLAEAGIDCLRQTKVGDNEGRVAAAIGEAMDRADAVVVCGGLGPTPDDVTREALAAAIGVSLERDAAMEARIRQIFAGRGRPMSSSNLRQADRPAAARFIEQLRGTAPGLVCEGPGGTVVYVVPGVPHEMEEMLRRAVMPELRRRAGAPSVIRSRVLRTWGLAESVVAEMVAPRLEAAALSASGLTIAFLAREMEGIQLRVTVRGEDEAAATRLLDAEEAELRAILGDAVFGVDDQPMEKVVGGLLVARAWTLGVAESLTGGLVGALLTEAAGASAWFRGSIVSYASDVKHDLLGIPPGPVVSERAAAAMAEGAARVLGADVGIAVTGVAGPSTQDGHPVGTVFMAVHADGRTTVTEANLPGDRARVRRYATISLLDAARRRLARPGSGG